MKEKSTINKVYDLISKSKRYLTARQIILKLDGIGDPMRRVRQLQEGNSVSSKWVTKKIKGKTRRYKVYYPIY